jgi:uncharacterized protein YndB with AHSA1/START domain
MTVLTDPTISLSLDRHFAAPPAEVFRHWADPALRQRWWGPKGFACPDFASDFRVGGDWSATIASPEHGALRMAGTYREIVPDRRILFTFRWTSDLDPLDTLVTVTLARTAAGGTRQTFHQAPFGTAASRDSHAEGWGECLDRQVAALAGSE